MRAVRSILTEIRGLDCSPRVLRRFAALVGTIVGVVGILLWPGFLSGALLSVTGMLLAGIAMPRMLTGPYRVWMTFALVLGYIMTRTVLGLVFFLVVTPLGLIMRLLGRDPMNRKLNPDAPTYWIQREKEENSRERLEKLY